MMMRKIFRPFSLALMLVILALTACSDPEVERVEHLLKKPDQVLANLKKALDGKQLTNARIVEQYATRVREISPKNKKLIDILALEATSKGGMYTRLTKRSQDLKKRFEAESGKSRQALFDIEKEALAIANAGNQDVYNDSLVDVANVLADMSKGELPKLKFHETRDKQMPPTQHLVGNGTYGQWRRGSDGYSYWAWYGQYRLMSDLIGWGSPYRYQQDYWYSNRSPSYYGDIGRHYYGSRASNDSWNRATIRQPRVASNKVSPAQTKTFKSTSRLSTFAPRTTSAPRTMARVYADRTGTPVRTGTGTYRPKRVSSSYSNSRSSPSRSSSYRSRGGK